MSDIDLKEIRKWLEHGRIQQIAEACDLKPQAASKILQGKVKRPNVKFLNAVMDEALRNKRTLMEKQKALKD